MNIQRLQIVLFLSYLPLVAMESNSLQYGKEEYELFTLVQKMHRIVREARKETEKYFGRIDSRALIDDPLTKTLTIEAARGARSEFALVQQESPLFLSTPLGMVEFFNYPKQPTIVSNHMGHIAASQRIFQHINAQLIDVSNSNNSDYPIGYKDVIGDVNPTSRYQDEQTFKSIASHEIHRYFNSNNLLVNVERYYCTRYTITHVDGQSTPDLKKIPIRPVEQRAVVWKLMQDQYKKENK